MSNHVGRWWIAGYDCYQGETSEHNKLGHTQGDQPSGTMTSKAFTIQKNKIGFLVGGACLEEGGHVSLIVNSQVMFIVRGRCVDTMMRVEWVVKMYIGKQGVIEIFDGIGDWGHINVDDFVFYNEDR
eukprot:UN05191